MLPECPQCGARMHLNDQTTNVVEFACARCHATVIEADESAAKVS